MKQIKNLAVLASRMLTAVVVVMVCGLFASCTNEAAPITRAISVDGNPTPTGPYYGERIINDSTKRDSVIVDGEVDKIDLKFTIRAREDREVFVDNFDNPQAEEYFSSDRRLLDSRRDGNWLVYTYVTNPHKGVQVGPTGETVSYETYEEVATYVPTSHDFTSKGWEVVNTSDVFKGAQISSKEGYTELDYTNGIKATYTGVFSSKVVNLEEKIAFFANEGVPVPDPVKVDHYEATGQRTDYPTYTNVMVEKFAVYTDGTRESAGKFSANLPIAVNPLTNWTITVDNLGTYVSNAFSGTQTGKEAKTAEKFFSYNNYTYRYANTVAGKENALSVSVPNNIVFKDDDVEYKFANTSLNVAKGNEATTQKGNNVYAYNVVANVTFGASQAVTLPGTINIKAASIDHYKVINASRNDYPTYTTVALEKIAVYTDGTEKSAGKFSANLPIAVNPLTNWTISVDALGTYVANAFSGNQTGKEARTAEKFFSYNNYTYRYANTVAGKENALSVSVPNDIVFKDDDVEYKFANTSLNVAKGAENTSLRSEDDSKKVYAYNVAANVTFGASQSVNLPGTINVKKAASINHYKVINASRNDYPTYTTVALEKIAVYTDGTEKSAGKFSANLPIAVNPLTNWTITVDALGTYVSNAFSGTQTGKEARTAEKFFSYNQYTYRYANTVAGQTNALSVSVPNDIVFNDGDVKHTFSNTNLNVAKGNEATTFRSEDDSKKTYAYTCGANVTFGASQAVTLPGTVNVKKAAPEPEPNHEHGKVKEVIFTTTQNENCSFYKSVCVIVFEDGYRSVGMAENDSQTFTFNMSSTTNGVNSAVYADGKWQVSKAEDNTSAKCMIWRNEGGQAKRTLDFVTATAKRWNNGHNTIKDPRRSYTIIDGGYGVTLSLNGSAGQTLHF